MAIRSFNFRYLLLFLLGLSGSATADDLFNQAARLDGPEILPVDEAFRLTASRQDDVVTLFWQITPGYYLYKHRLKASSSVALGALAMKPGKPKTDEYFGQVEVYYELLEVKVPIREPDAGPIDLLVEYQGCADAGICYPPRKKILSP